jgi:hypothetical protein
MCKARPGFLTAPRVLRRKRGVLASKGISQFGSGLWILTALCLGCVVFLATGYCAMRQSRMANVAPIEVTRSVVILDPRYNNFGKIGVQDMVSFVFSRGSCARNSCPRCLLRRRWNSWWNYSNPSGCSRQSITTRSEPLICLLQGVIAKEQTFRCPDSNSRGLAVIHKAKIGQQLVVGVNITEPYNGLPNIGAHLIFHKLPLLIVNPSLEANCGSNDNADNDRDIDPYKPCKPSFLGFGWVLCSLACHGLAFWWLYTGLAFWGHYHYIRRLFGGAMTLLAAYPTLWCGLDILKCTGLL